MTVLLGSSSYVNWGSLGKILIIGIIAGAGLVSVYSLGLVALSASGYLRKDAEHRSVIALIAAVLCVAVVIAGVVFGIVQIFSKG